MKFDKRVILWGSLLAVVLFALSIISIAIVRNTVTAEDIYLPSIVGEPVVITLASSRNLNEGETLTVACDSEGVTSQQLDDNTVWVSCVEPTAVVTETVITTAAVGDVAPYAAAPPCAVHDPTAYHGLWNEVDGCHYDHTHNFSPLAPEVVDIFGDYTEFTGQEVSYPWQTFAGAAPGYPPVPVDVHYENDFKHPGYKFDFKDLLSYGICPVAFPGVRAVPNAWLIERHSLGDHNDFLSRVHSVFAMVRFCIPGTSEEAFLITGGWQDFGQRISPYQGQLIPLVGNPSPSYNTARQPYWQHGCINNPALCKNFPGEITAVSQAQQIPGHALFGYGFRGSDAIDAIDATNGLNNPNPSFVYLCRDAQGNYNPIGCRFNNTANHTFQVTGYILPAHDLLDGIDDDRVTWEGYTDRWGVIVQGCTVAGLDCIPTQMVNMPTGVYHANLQSWGDDFLPAHHADTLPDYDLCWSPAGALVDCDTPGATYSGWISSSN